MHDSRCIFFCCHFIKPKLEKIGQLNLNFCSLRYPISCFQDWRSFGLFFFLCRFLLLIFGLSHQNLLRFFGPHFLFQLMKTLTISFEVHVPLFQFKILVRFFDWLCIHPNFQSKCVYLRWTDKIESIQRLTPVDYSINFSSSEASRSQAGIWNVLHYCCETKTKFNFINFHIRVVCWQFVLYYPCMIKWFIDKTFENTFEPAKKHSRTFTQFHFWPEVQQRFRPFFQLWATRHFWWCSMPFEKQFPKKTCWSTFSLTPLCGRSRNCKKRTACLRHGCSLRAFVVETFRSENLERLYQILSQSLFWSEFWTWTQLTRF